MKKNHIYQWPDYYDWTSDGLDGDMAYYANLAMESGGPVLELGCGTGRCSLGVARHGIEVVGVDKQPEMIEVAEKKAHAMDLSHRCQWICGDMTDFDLEKKFPLVMIPYRSFLHLLSIRDQLAALQKVREHLTDDGVFAFNVFVPNVSQLVEEDERYVCRGNFFIPGTDESVDVYDYTEFDFFHQRASITRYYERFASDGMSLSRLRTNFSIRYIFPAELFHLLHVGGFQIIHRYGGFRREPFGPGSSELVVEARKRKKRGSA
ncbi:class I SAM-dependent methyltransferase [Melghirimyces algeriensis]|uniref:Methyltransferase domain-containing protein n=1 Tax=Melghirimyces algeriensis TaxID=910412 RepID=A0A521DUL8_9BACL|nr:class I SAM-dependent methyltransferase [Melghirimyces algeriensis]SMO75416.1 Methyltransferase domain-containing protein [Melghirimyces algeriensis]